MPEVPTNEAVNARSESRKWRVWFQSLPGPGPQYGAYAEVWAPDPDEAITAALGAVHGFFSTYPVQPTWKVVKVKEQPPFAPRVVIWMDGERVD